MIRPLLYGLFGVLLFSSCAIKPRGGFLINEAPPTPDYSLDDSWAALPTKFDSADLLPNHDLRDRQSSALVDVFFLYPTTYTGKRGQNRWNADVADEKVNLKTDKTAIRYQATIFNGVGRVYAPRYRQAHLEAFYTKKNKADAQKALDLAYNDVRASFAYYLKYHNQGRPIIIAAHSQGTLHAGRLLREYFDGKPLANALIAAYLVGMPVKKTYFDELKPCISPDEVGCYCSWRTVREDFIPKKWHDPDTNIAVTNPLTWMTDPGYADKELNKGAVLKKFSDGVLKEFTGAKIEQGFLWVPRPKIPGVPFLPTRNYHVADYNFFYLDVRENARLRADAYFHTRS